LIPQRRRRAQRVQINYKTVQLIAQTCRDVSPSAFKPASIDSGLEALAETARFSRH
jgi:hypothetical protein